MDLKILIATPDRSFGGLISQTLREADYSPLLAPNAAEAAFIIQDEKCPIAILDCKLPDPGPNYLATELRARFPDMRLIFINSGEGSIEPAKVNPACDILLPRPFFMPDLLEVIHLWFAEKKASMDEAQQSYKPPPIPSKLAWLQDVNKAAQYLTRLSLEVDAQTALIIRDSRIWASAGHLSQDAIEELAQFVGHHWANGDGSDLARFVRLESTDSEFILYATHLGSGFVLALSFKTEMPFTKMRAQTGALARKLTSPLQEIPGEIENEHVLEETDHAMDDFKPVEGERALGVDGVRHVNDDDGAYPDEALNEQQQAKFEDLLTTLDIPDPDGSNNLQLSQTTTNPIQRAEVQPVEVSSQKQKPTLLPETRVEAPLILETAPIQDADPLTQADVQLDSESFALHDLAYACILIPRLPEHNLTGVLTGLLNVEVSRLCLAFGWRLEHLGVHPEYLHWVVGVTPDESAARVIRNIREQTSALLFAEFPRLAKENPSGDFWAPGFLVIHGRRSLAGSLVQDFIQKTRARQGIGQK